METMTVGTKFNGVTLKPSRTSVSRKKEAPFMKRLLQAKSRGEAVEAVNSGRSYSERRREDTRESIQGKLRK